VSINTDNKDEANRIFDRLSEGGKIIMPMNKTFWDSYFGMFTEKYGIQCMVNCGLQEHKDYEQKK